MDENLETTRCVPAISTQLTGRSGSMVVIFGGIAISFHSDKYILLFRQIYLKFGQILASDSKKSLEMFGSSSMDPPRHLVPSFHVRAKIPIQGDSQP